MSNALSKALKQKTDAMLRLQGQAQKPVVYEAPDGSLSAPSQVDYMAQIVAGKNVNIGTSGSNKVINAIMNVLAGANITVSAPDVNGAVTVSANIGGKPIDLTGLMDGHVLKYDSVSDSFIVGEGGGGGLAEVPQATETTFGGIKAKAKTTESNEAAIDPITGKLYVSDGGGALVNQKNGLPLKLWVGLESEYIATNPIDSETLYFRKGPTNFGKISIGSTVIIGQPSALMNVASGKTSTKSSNTTISNGFIEYVTNGNKTTDQYVAFSNSSDGNPVYVQIDLAGVYEVAKIIVWRFFGDGRTYNNTKVSISPDGTTWTDVFDSAVQGVYPETSAGKTVEFSAKPARYVRVYGNGSNQNDETHLVEVEVFAEVST